MYVPGSKSFVPAIVILALFLCLPASAQTRSKNNPYSPSPAGKQERTGSVAKPDKQYSTEVAFIVPEGKPTVRETVPGVVPRTFKIIKSAQPIEQPITAIYRIGVDDVLFINLKNAANASGYYAIRSDGSIDYPLAGGRVSVLDRTAAAVAEMLAATIKLYADPQIEVKVHDYLSHQITVSGLANNGGEKNLRREAMPLFALRAEAEVSSQANHVLITRAAGSKPESYDLKDQVIENILIYPGDAVEFTFVQPRPTGIGQYFLAGDVALPGRRELTMGMTLYRAIVAAGGTKGGAKRAIIRRINDKGVTIIERSLRPIEEGKAIDPILLSGDVIQIKN